MTKDEIDTLITEATNHIFNMDLKHPDTYKELETAIRAFMLQAIRGAESDASRIIYDAASRIGERRKS